MSFNVEISHLYIYIFKVKTFVVTECFVKHSVELKGHLWKEFQLKQLWAALLEIMKALLFETMIPLGAIIFILCCLWINRAFLLFPLNIQTQFLRLYQLLPHTAPNNSPSKWQRQNKEDKFRQTDNRNSGNSPTTVYLWKLSEICPLLHKTIHCCWQKWRCRGR